MPLNMLTESEAFEADEAVSRGDACICGAEWHPTSPTSSELIHNSGCRLVAFIDAQPEED